MMLKHKHNVIQMNASVCIFEGNVKIIVRQLFQTPPPPSGALPLDLAGELLLPKLHCPALSKLFRRCTVCGGIACELVLKS